MKSIALIKCSSESMVALEDAFGSVDTFCEVLDPTEEGFLETARKYDGYVISGSVDSVVDDSERPRVANVLALIRQVREQSDAPIVGICFGAQAIGKALGGQVSRNPSGKFRLGVDTLSWQPAHPVGRWPSPTTPTSVAKSHGEYIASLPPDTEVIASSKTTPHEIFLVERRFLGVQGHPEIDNVGLQQGYLQFHRPMFDTAQWSAVVQDAQQPIDRHVVLALGRRLLLQGRL